MKIDWNQKYTTVAVYVFLTALAIILLLFSFLNLDGIQSFLTSLNNILAPVYIGLALAYIANPIMKMCEKRIFRFKANNKRKLNLKRGLSILLTYMILLIILTVIFLLIIPQAILSLTDLASKMEGYIADTVAWLDKFLAESTFIGEEINNVQDILGKFIEFFDLESLTSELQKLISGSFEMLKNYVPQLISAISGIAGMFFDIVLGIFFSIYFLASKEKLIAQFKKVFRAFSSSKIYSSTLELCRFTDKTFGNYLVGKIIDSLIVGVLCYIACAACRIPYAILVSMLVAVTNVIPVIGPFIGAVPGVFIIFIVDPMKAFWFIVINIVLQQVDGNIIVPKLLGETTGLSSLWVLFSITVMGGLWGLFGMFISVPIFAVFYALIKLFIEKRLQKRELPVETVNYYDEGSEQALASEEGDSPHSFASNMKNLTSELTHNHLGAKIKRKIKQKSDSKSDEDTSADDDHPQK